MTLLSTTHSSKQLTSDDTNIFSHLLLFIDFVDTDQPNCVNDCGTRPSSNKNCHH